METALIIAYLFVLGVLAIYGLHRSELTYLFVKNRHKTPTPAREFDDLPKVTVQLPTFNERYVVERLIESITRMDYPQDRLEIQVLDDSTDDTQEIARRKVEEVRARGFDAHYIHRTNREGYKAGALENGLRTAKGEFVAVFDADFVPSPGLLRDTIHHFSDPRIGMVQTRWDHLNRDYSMLTRIQALMLDGHFVVEHTARANSGRFFNFNGTAGIWRHATIVDAGGWAHDTLTEDTDLSYRAQLRGWKFVYLPDVVAPAELPVEMNSFKSQQFRWAKGLTQTARKLLPTVLRSDAPFKVKLEAIFHLTNNFAYVFIVLLTLLLLPNLLMRTHHGWREVLLIDIPLFVGTTGSVGLFYGTTTRALRRSVWEVVRRLPVLMAIGIGMSINNARAVIEGLFGGGSNEFVRTPKHGVRARGEAWRHKAYRSSRTIVAVVELFFAAYSAWALVLAFQGGHFIAMPFIALFVFGFLYVGTLSVYQPR